MEPSAHTCHGYIGTSNDLHMCYINVGIGKVRVVDQAAAAAAATKPTG